MKRESPEPKRLPACATAMMRKRERLSGRVKLTWARPSGPATTDGFQYAVGTKSERRSMPSKPAPLPPPPPRFSPFSPKLRWPMT